MARRKGRGAGINTQRTRSRVAYGVSRLTSRLGITRDQALGVMGSLAGESGIGLNPGAFNPDDPGGGSKGIGQWHSERARAMSRYVKSAMAKDPKKSLFEAQMDFAVAEAKTIPGLVDSLKASKTRAAASKTWTKKFEMPAAKYSFHAKRAKNAEYYAGLLGTQATPIDEPVDESLTGAEVGTEEAAYAENESGSKQRRSDSIFGKVLGALEDVGGGVRKVAEDIDSTTDRVTSELEDSGDGFFGDVSNGAMAGSLVGGAIGGPTGAIIGGLVGQGLSRLTDRIFNDEETDDDVEGTGDNGGSVFDGLADSIGSMFGGDRDSESSTRSSNGSGADPRGPGWGGTFGLGTGIGSDGEYSGAHGEGPGHQGNKSSDSSGKNSDGKDKGDGKGFR